MIKNVKWINRNNFNKKRNEKQKSQERKMIIYLEHNPNAKIENNPEGTADAEKEKNITIKGPNERRQRSSDRNKHSLDSKRHVKDNNSEKCDNIKKAVKQTDKSELVNKKKADAKKSRKQTQRNKSKSETEDEKLTPRKKQKRNKEAVNYPPVDKEKVDSKKQLNKLDAKRLEEMLADKQSQIKKEKGFAKPESLRDRMMEKLRASRFRYLNETLYNNQSSDSKKYFKDDPDAFTAYHNGYKQQIQQWPLNPLDVIIESVKKMPKEHVIADFGCGEARLATSVTNKVHSFDFVSLNKLVTACDMARTNLLTGGVHVVVFCLSLMGTNLEDYIIEANRVLKKDGILKIAEVESRFENVEDFVKILSDYGFKNTWTDLSHNLFYFLDFKKEKEIIGNRSKLPRVTLKPCLYKKR